MNVPFSVGKHISNPEGSEVLQQIGLLNCFFCGLLWWVDVK